MALGGEVGDEGLNFGDAHVFGVAFVVEEDVAADPVYVGLFGALGVVFDANGVADLFEEFPGFRWISLRFLRVLRGFCRFF